MISVYDIGNEEYTRNGDAVLFPTSCAATEDAGGSYEIALTHPIDDSGKWTHLADGAIVKAPVPVPTIENAYIGEDVDVYGVNAGGADLREGPREPTAIRYQEWQAGGAYTVGARVTCSNWTSHKNYQCINYDSGSQQTQVPPYNNPSWWRQIPDYTNGAAILTRLPADTEVYFIEDAGSGWYKVGTKFGIDGYLKSSQVTFLRHETVEPVPPREIEDQLFRIYKVTQSEDGKSVTVNARHVSYDLAGVLIQNCNLSLLEPARAIMRIKDSFMIPYRGEIATNLTGTENGTYTGNLSGKNGVFAFLDPDKGMIPYFRAKLIRDNWDLFLLKNDLADRGFRITYGINMIGAQYTRSISDLITRVVPVAKNADGSELYLPEMWIDSPNINHWRPLIIMERLPVDGQIGKDDGTGTGTTWTEEALLEHMRTKANERFSVDHVDAEKVELNVTFSMLGDTVEYQQYKELEKVYLYDIVHVYDERRDLNRQLQVSQIVWDCIRQRYISIKVGNVFDYGGRSVFGYNIGNGAIAYEKISLETIQRIISEVR